MNPETYAGKDADIIFDAFRTVSFPLSKFYFNKFY